MVNKVPEFPDRSIHALLSSSKHMLSLLRLTVPEIAEFLDPESLQSFQTKHVDEDFQVVNEDIIYQARIREKEIFFFVLVAHQSSVDHAMAFRLSYAMHLLWHRQLKEQKQKNVSKPMRRLQVIIPIVLHTGLTPWRVVAFDKLFDAHELLESFVPKLKITTLDLASIDESILVETKSVFAELLRLFWAHPKSPEEFARVSKNLLTNLKSLAPEQEEYLGLVRFFLNFAYNRRDQAEWDTMKNIVVEATERQGENEMGTIADYLREEGLKKGLEKGKLEGLEKGLEKGKLEGQRQLLELLLAQKYPDQDKDANSAKLASITDPKFLQELSLKLMNNVSWDELWESLKP